MPQMPQLAKNRHYTNYAPSPPLQRVNECNRLFTTVIIESVMDHDVKFPIYVCLNDGEVMRIESFEKILYQLEAIDIENDEYLFWDANGRGLKILTEKNAVSGFRNADNRLSCRQAIEIYATQLAVPIDTSGTLDEAWARVLKAKESLPRPRSFWRRLFGR